MILHIPHSSLKIPGFAKKSFVIDHKKLDELKFFFCDNYTGWLYRGGTRVMAKFSRLFFDPERFEDDEKEPMSKLGMGMIYTKSYTGEIISNPTQKHIEKAKKEYHKHHERLDAAAQKELKNKGKCLIIDCHSFPEELARAIVGGAKEFPDICIGVDEDFKDEKVVKFSKEYFENLGYDVAENFPYSGSLVPNKAYAAKNKRVKSVMIEINKKVYLTNGKKNENFVKLKSQINDYLKKVEKLFYGE